MASRHRTIRSMFLDAFDNVQRLAAQSPNGPPNLTSPALGPPQGPPMSRPGVGSGDPDLLNLLGIEVGRAGYAWEDAGRELSRLLGWLGLSEGPGQSITRSGSWIADQKSDLERRRDDLVKAGVVSPPIPQPANPPPQPKSTGFFSGAWNGFAHHFVPGLWDVVKDNTKNTFAMNPVTSPFYMLYDHKDWQQRQLTTITFNLIKGLRALSISVEISPRDSSTTTHSRWTRSGGRPTCSPTSPSRSLPSVRVPASRRHNEPPRVQRVL
jgi:hypothetical protein